MKQVLIFVVILIIGFLGTKYTWGDITGGDEVTKWINLPITNYNAMFFAMLAGIGAFVGIMFKIVINSKKAVKD